MPGGHGSRRDSSGSATARLAGSRRSSRPTHSVSWPGRGPRLAVRKAISRTPCASLVISVITSPVDGPYALRLSPGIHSLGARVELRPHVQRRAPAADAGAGGALGRGLECR